MPGSVWQRDPAGCAAPAGRKSRGLSEAGVSVFGMAELSRCPVCCEHGVSNEAWCDWCDELLEFGTSEFIVTEADLALPCVHAEEQSQAS